MSFMIWYQVELDEPKPEGGLLAAAKSLVGVGLPLRVSNDVFGGAFVLDADITVTMAEGAVAGTYSITLLDLPDASIALLRSRHAAAGLTATIRLGYFDEPATRSGYRPVVTGPVMSLESTRGDDGRGRTVIRGQEKAGYLLRTTPAATGTAEPISTLDYTTALVKTAEVAVAPGSTMHGTLRRHTVKGASVLAEVQNLARYGKCALVVRDGSVYLGKAVGKDPAPVTFDPGTNIVRRGDTQADVPAPTRLQLTVLGHPGLRAGQEATVKGLDGVPAPPLRTVRVVHRFTTSGGYTCDLLLVAVPVGEPVQVADGVQSVVDRMYEVVGRQRTDHPAVDVGEVTEYQPGADGKHLASLHYGQSPVGEVVTPSVSAVVDTGVELHSKPIASPFAFHRCGLVLPVYPGMRALLAHNNSLVNDAVVAGWLWSEQPRHEPPKSKPGDYWLALPSEIGPNGLPKGGGVNDLIDAMGRRVIQVNALKVSVGLLGLPPVGTRPEPMPGEDTLTIEHTSGTTITVDASGALTIRTSSKKMTLTNGQVSVTLSGSTVDIGPAKPPPDGGS